MGSRYKYTIDNMQEVAKIREGRCLSNEYISYHIKLSWQCKKGHVWKTPPSIILAGGWCPMCAKNYAKYNIDDMNNFARKKEGYCLSDKYINSITKLKWRCAKGHVWTTIPKLIIKGFWCPHCAGKAKLTIFDMRATARKRGGKCLSNKYFYKDKLKWQCKKGHRWLAVGNGIRNGQWCPYCAHSIKSTIEDMRKMADSKGGQCLSNKYVNTQIKLKWMCKYDHIWESRPAVIKNGHWCPHCSGTARKNINDMYKLAAGKGGKCLSDKYINNHSKMTWECAEGHQWETVPNCIQNGQWCPYCCGNRRHTIEEMQKAASIRKGKCLSPHYINNKTKLKWICEKGHKWNEIPNKIINKGHWCKVCAKNRKSN